MEEPTESDDYDFIPPIQRRQANDDDDEIDDDDGAPDPSVLDRAARLREVVRRADGRRFKRQRGRDGAGRRRPRHRRRAVGDWSFLPAFARHGAANGLLLAVWQILASFGRARDFGRRQLVVDVFVQRRVALGDGARRWAWACGPARARPQAGIQPR